MWMNLLQTAWHDNDLKAGPIYYFIVLLDLLLHWVYRCGSRGARGPGPPLTPVFEAPNLSFLGPSLIFLYFLSLALLGIQFLSYFNIFHSLNSKILQPRKLKVEVLAHIGIPKPQLLLVIFFISCNMYCEDIDWNLRLKQCVTSHIIDLFFSTMSKKFLASLRSPYLLKSNN